MARSSFGLGLILIYLLAAGVAFADVQAPDVNDLKTQVLELAKQVQEAEDGKFAAQKLLEESKTKQLSFATEIKKLKESLSHKDTQESTLQSQLVLLQEEVKKLKTDEDVHKDLTQRFEAVSGELKSTKDKLAATLTQLADSSTSASASERSVQDATEKLQVAAQKERAEALAKLTELEKGAQKATKLQGEVDNLKAESKKLKGELADSKAKASEAASAVASWKAKAEKAEQQVESAEKTLEKALQDHSSTQSALIQAEARAEEAVRKMEALLTSWLPHWLEQTLKELEDLAILYLRKVPALKPYAQRPTVTYLVWAVLAAPIVTIFVPLIALGGGKKKGSKKVAPAQGAERPAKGGSKAKKGRRITEGEESIRVP